MPDHRIKVEGISHRVQKNVNILLNMHTLEPREDGERFCSMCKCVWPCPTRILILGYSDLVKEKHNAEVSKRDTRPGTS